MSERKQPSLKVAFAHGWAHGFKSIHVLKENIYFEYKILFKI